MTLTKPYVVDADSHWSEPADLFTKRAPEHLKGRVPHHEVIDGKRQWVMDGVPIGMAGSGAVIGRDGMKAPSEIGLHEWHVEDAHKGASDPEARLQVLDDFGIDAQVIFPSTIGLGGQGLGQIADQDLCRIAVEIYNDGMAEIQANSGNRLLPMPLMPAWDIDLAISEAKRVAGLGVRGVNMTSDPQDLGAPDLADRAWDPFWATCAENSAPGALPHRGEHHRHDLLRPVLLAVADGRHEARHRRLAALHRQRPGRDEPDPRGDLRPPSRSQVRVGRERRGVDPLHPRDARLRDVRERAGRPGEAQEAAVGVLPEQPLRDVLVRAQRRSSSSSWSTRSARTTSSSRPTSRTRRACTRTRSRASPTRWPRSPRRRA